MMILAFYKALAKRFSGEPGVRHKGRVKIAGIFRMRVGSLICNYGCFSVNYFYFPSLYFAP